MYSYHVPKHIQEHLDYITPGIRLLSATERGRAKRGFGMTSGYSGKKTTPTIFPCPAADNLATCDVAITPACEHIEPAYLNIS